MNRSWPGARRIVGAMVMALVLSGLMARSAAAQGIVRITVRPGPLDLAVGQVVLLQAEATFTDGSVANISELVEWRSSNNTVARVSNTRGSKGKVTAKASGQVSISVRDPVSGVGSGQSGGNALLVVLGKLSSLQVTPKDRRIDVGATKTLQAIATFSSGVTRDLSASVTWTSSNAAVARVSNEQGRKGRVTAVTPGRVQISVSSSTGVTSTATGGDATVRVPAALLAIRVKPDVTKVPLGLVVQLVAEGSYSDGSTDDISDQVNWSSSAPAIASVSDAGGSKGEVTALQLGSALISIVDPTTGLASTPAGGDALVTVAGALIGLELNPTEERLPTGLTRSFSVTALLDDGGKLSLSRRAVQWSSSDPNVASVGNEGSTAGVVTAVAKGSAVVSALHVATGVRSAKGATVTVLGRMIGIAVRPRTRELFTGQVERFNAMALLDDGEEARLTRDVEFFSSDGDVATISNQSGSRGSATGVSKGRATISVRHKATEMTSTDFGEDAVAVVNGRVEALRVEPAKGFYVLGTEPKLKVRATFDDGSSANIGSDVIWTSSDPSIAEIGNQSPKRGVLTPKQIGRITVSAVEPVSGITTTTSGGDGTVTIVDGLLDLRVRDDNLELRTGDVLNLKTAGRFPDPTNSDEDAPRIEIDMTDFVEWTSSNEAVVRVEAGRLTAVGLGEATVSARDPRSGISSSTTGGDATFRVIAALSRLKLSPRRVRVRMGAGRRRAFEALGIYTDGARIELTDRVQFATADSSIAQVSNERDRHGLVVPAKAGVTTARATEPITQVGSEARKIIVKGRPHAGR